MATLAGLSHEFEEVVTFGEPRVGAGVGRHFRAGNHVRVVNGDDPVTKVPLAIPGSFRIRRTVDRETRCPSFDSSPTIRV